MKLKEWIVASVATLMFLPSCIKEEGAYQEADIIKFTLPADIMLMPTIINLKGDNRVEVVVYDTIGMKEALIAPEIEVSPGAVISPASGEEVQLKDYKATYTVTAEDGDQKMYTIMILPDKPQKYNFESWYEVTKDPKRIYEMLSDGLWSNANDGLAKVNPAYKSFPTRKTTECYSGEYGMLLESTEGVRSPLFVMDIPLFAGSAFRGTFKTNASDPVTSAKFGQIHAKSSGKPLFFKGWYKYKPGKVFQTCTVTTVDKKKVNIVEYDENRKDEPDIYAIFFKVPKGNDGKDIYLNANDVKTSDRIIATAILEDTSEKADWTQFNIPFEYIEEIDYSQNDYKLAIVFSSSSRGAFYEGAPGSRLLIDEVEVVTLPID